ncbi:protocadherin Fat 1 isoform X1 [Brachionus plicatilis]|uniref:Protocadherin Fat 1 isoform X1 n=1 Tax=Brachionus plicatilis TaxID=10195 RepID=A0A3M7QP06_BRAPC|nr:protocadherin Fat 1 isoform X1 [Brachionus plicatilis]
MVVDAIKCKISIAEIKMLKIIRSLFFLCLINKHLTADNAIYQFAASLDSKYLKIYNNEEELKTISLNDLSHSLDFDPDTNIMIGSSLNKKVLTWNITQSNENWSQEETADTRAIAFLNKTHFIAGFNGFFVIYACSNLNNKLKKTDSTKIGQVYDIKILHEDQKILIASHEGYISVYDLLNYNFLKKNQIADKIWGIDAFDQNLIVSQCNQILDVCLYNLDSSSSLIELMRQSGVVFGGDKFLKIWEISTNQIIETISFNDKALSLDIFSSQIIASGQENDGVKFWNITNYINTGSKVNQHSTQLQNLESTHTTFINMQTTYESTEQKFITSKPSSIDTLIPTASDTVAESTTKLIQTIQETGQPSEYLSSSSIIFQLFTTINHENQISPTEPSIFEYFTDTLKNTNTMSSELYSEKQSENTNEELKSTTLDKEKTTIKSTFFELSETATSHSEQQSDRTSRELDLSTSNIKNTKIESTFFDSNTRSTSNSQESSAFTLKPVRSSSAEQEKTFHSTQKVNTAQRINTKTSHSSFDALPETNSNMVTNIQHHLKEDFSFSNLLPSELIEVLKKNYEMNDCLKNCSGNGLCKLINKTLFFCECFNNFAGSSCQINTLPCASNPCLNNGTCVNNLANKTFICHCQQDNNGNYLYFGKNCQNKVDVCANETCSKNGVCYDVNDKAKCKCFSSYSGEKCQIESDEMIYRAYFARKNQRKKDIRNYLKCSLNLKSNGIVVLGSFERPSAFFSASLLGIF